MKSFVIDRIEGDYAICVGDNSEVMDVKLSKLSFEAKEGLCILFDEKTSVFTVDLKATDILKSKNDDRLKNLFGRQK